MLPEATAGRPPAGGEIPLDPPAPCQAWRVGRADHRSRSDATYPSTLARNGLSSPGRYYGSSGVTKWSGDGRRKRGPGGLAREAHARGGRREGIRPRPLSNPRKRHGGPLAVRTSSASAGGFQGPLPSQIWQRSGAPRADLTAGGEFAVAPPPAMASCGGRGKRVLECYVSINLPRTSLPAWRECSILRAHGPEPGHVPERPHPLVAIVRFSHADPVFLLG